MTRFPRTIRSKATAAVLVGLVGVGGGLSMAAASPNSSDTSAPSSASPTGDQPGDPGTTQPDHPHRTDRLRALLTPLVEDGTITSTQADEVAATLAETRLTGGHHRGGPAHKVRVHLLATAADVLGMSPQELPQALREGQTTLADVAEAHGVPTQKLIDALVSEGTDKLRQRVTTLVEEATPMVRPSGGG